MKMYVYDARTGATLGTGRATVIDRTQLRYDSRTWEHTVSFHVDWATGLAVAGAVQISLTGCGHGCHVQGSAAPKPYALRKTTTFSFTLTSPGKSILYHREDTHASFSCAACKGRFSKPSLQATNPTVRCDSTPDQGSGCAYKDIIPTFKLTRQGKGGQSAQLIYAAQHDPSKGHYGWQGHGPVLHRTKDQEWLKANRTAARAICRQEKNPPPHSNCDEYPFASTREGNAKNPLALAKMIDEQDNNTAGNYLNNFYMRNRITVDGDRFWVFIP